MTSTSVYFSQPLDAKYNHFDQGSISVYEDFKVSSELELMPIYERKCLHCFIPMSSHHNFCCAWCVSQYAYISVFRHVANPVVGAPLCLVLFAVFFISLLMSQWTVCSVFGCAFVLLLFFILLCEMLCESRNEKREHHLAAAKQ